MPGTVINALEILSNLTSKHSCKANTNIISLLEKQKPRLTKFHLPKATQL